MAKKCAVLSTAVLVMVSAEKKQQSQQQSGTTFEKVSKNVSDVYSAYMPIVTEKVNMATAVTSECTKAVQEFAFRLYNDEKLHAEVQEFMMEKYEVSKVHFDTWKAYGMERGTEAMDMSRMYYLQAKTSAVELYDKNVPAEQKKQISELYNKGSAKVAKQYAEFLASAEVLRSEHSIPTMEELYVRAAEFMRMSRDLLLVKVEHAKTLFELEVRPRFEDAKARVSEKVSEVADRAQEVREEYLSAESLSMRAEDVQEIAKDVYFWVFFKSVEMMAHPTARSAMQSGSEAWELIKTHADQGVSAIEMQFPEQPVRKYLNYENAKNLAYYWFMLYIVAYLVVYKVVVRNVLPCVLCKTCCLAKCVFCLCFRTVRCALCLVVCLVKLVVCLAIAILVKLPLAVVSFALKLAFRIVAFPFIVIRAMLCCLFCCRCRSNSHAVVVAATKKEVGKKVVEKKTVTAKPTEKKVPASASNKPAVASKPAQKPAANAKKGKKSNP